MTDTPGIPDSPDAPGPEQGGGPPALMPWTLVVEDEGWSADLEHGAPLPRIGDRVEFIADDGQQRSFRVFDVVHTIQRSAGERPRVREEHAGPNSTVDRPSNEPPRELRAGLPRVYVSAEGEQRR
jgi:hypothetical protein